MNDEEPKENGQQIYTCRLALTIEEPWITMEPIYLGSVPSGRGTPDRYCLLEYDRRPLMRLDIFGQDMGFADIRTWNPWVVIGFADAVHFVSLDTNQQHSYSLHGYFGHLYSTEDTLLVASASDLLCFEKEATLRVRCSPSRNLAVEARQKRPCPAFVESTIAVNRTSQI
jgi:hypothetical protein